MAKELNFKSIANMEDSTVNSLSLFQLGDPGRFILLPPVIATLTLTQGYSQQMQSEGAGALDTLCDDNTNTMSIIILVK